MSRDLVTNEDSKAQRCGLVPIVGAPNVGKSTLLNRLVGAKVSIVSPKTQTTRLRIRGIAIIGEAQLILVDTPGLFTPRHRLDREMLNAAWSSLLEGDVILLVIDSVTGIDSSVSSVIDRLIKNSLKAVAVLNKVDQVNKSDLLKFARSLDKSTAFSRVFMISARTGDGVSDLADYLADTVPEGPWLFPDDQLSDQPNASLAAEITREKVYLLLRQEIPYSVTVETESWKQCADGSLRIDQTIYVEREGQKRIVIGEGGERIKRVGQASRQELERIFEQRVHLFLQVRVHANWRNDPSFLRRQLLTFR